MHEGRRPATCPAVAIAFWAAAFHALPAPQALAQETPPPAAEPSLFAAGWWVLLLVAVACVAFGGWVWWSYRGKK